jgi:hypothetical protein
MTRRRLIQVVAALAVLTSFTTGGLRFDADGPDAGDTSLLAGHGTAILPVGASGEGASARSVGLLDFRTLPIAAGPVHPDWPLVVAAEIPGPSGWLASQERAVEARAELFADLPALEPPNWQPPEWERRQGFFVAGPPGSADDRFEVAEVAWAGRSVTVTVEGWRSGRRVAPQDLRRPTHAVTIVPPLGPGVYDLTVVWRDFRPAPDRGPFWSLASVQRATSKLTVYPGAPPPGVTAIGLRVGDFRRVLIAPAETARRWLPVPAVRRITWINGFEGFSGRDNVGVAAGKLDPAAWERNIHTFRDDLPDHGAWAPARPAPVRPAGRGEPLYAVIYGPLEVNMDQCRVRTAEWTRDGYVLHVQFFHTGFVMGSNQTRTSAYVVPLLPPPSTGQIPVRVRWSVFHGNHWRSRDPAPFRRLGPGRGLPWSGDWYDGSANDHRPAWMDLESRCEMAIGP